MTTPIKADDHEALNRAFAEKVCGWKNSGTISHPKWEFGDPAGTFFANGTPDLIRHAELMLAHATNLLGFSVSTPKFQGDTFSVVATKLNGGEIDEFRADAPSFPLALAVAILRAHGVEVQD